MDDEHMKNDKMMQASDLFREALFKTYGTNNIVLLWGVRFPDSSIISSVNMGHECSPDDFSRIIVDATSMFYRRKMQWIPEDDDGPIPPSHAYQ